MLIILVPALLLNVTANGATNEKCIAHLFEHYRSMKSDAEQFYRDINFMNGENKKIKSFSEAMGDSDIIDFKKTLPCIDANFHYSEHCKILSKEGDYAVIYKCKREEEEFIFKLTRNDVSPTQVMTETFHQLAAGKVMQSFSGNDKVNVPLISPYYFSLGNSARFISIMQSGGTNLNTIMEQTTEKIEEKYVFAAVSHLNDHGIYHYDLTLLNILKKGDTLYIIDFGLAFVDDPEATFPSTHQPKTMDGYPYGTAHYHYPCAAECEALKLRDLDRHALEVLFFSFCSGVNYSAYRNLPSVDKHLGTKILIFDFQLYVKNACGTHMRLKEDESAGSADYSLNMYCPRSLNASYSLNRSLAQEALALVFMF